MLSKIYGAGIKGIEAFLVCVEADVSAGLPGVLIIGYVAGEVKEANDRVRTAIKNSGFELEPKKVTINLSPANIKKSGCAYDLPIAVSMLLAYKKIQAKSLEDSIFVGELSLSGNILPIRGAVSIAIEAKKQGFKNLYLPKENAKEAAVISEINSFGVSNISQLCNILNGSIKAEKEIYIGEEQLHDKEPDFADIKGQKLIKRATVIAVAGKHNILFIGPAGSGKSMLAKRIPGIMPQMSLKERIEISMINSICNIENKIGIAKRRPFRNPHHTISKQALIGGGRNPAPGEVSLSTHGVLFLDEFTEFRADIIETLRQPMEDKKVTISRVYGSYTYPADFILCAATNPCKCGFYPDKTMCSCNERSVKDYLGRISKPILDRIDICVELKSLKYEEMKSVSAEESSESIRTKVEKIREIQKNRFRNYNINFNGDMDKKLIDKFCILNKKDEEFLKKLYEKKNMSIRALHKVLKVARTIADFEGAKNIENSHLCEAVTYRSIEDKYWGKNV